MQSDNYYKIDRMSNSMLKHFKRSPRHYLEAKNNPEVTPAMIIGQAFHCLVLEEESFSNEFIVAPECDRRTTVGKNTWAEFQLKLKPGQQLLKDEDMEMIKRMKEALYNSKEAREYLDSLKWVERALMWKDDITGVECKGKLDGGNDEFTIDLKSCMDADPKEFSRYAFNNYITQPALYVDARGENKIPKGDFYFICVEKTPPFGVSILKCSNDFLQHGRYVYGEILSDFARWKSQGSPDVGYEWNNPLGYKELDLPAWAGKSLSY